MPRPRKVVLLGDFGVGKTSFGTRLAKGEFHESTLATLGVAQFAPGKPEQDEGGARG